jgi:hypothetical protein
MNTTSRLDEIANRQRTSRVRDVAFAIMVAALMTFSVTGLRNAVASTRQPAMAKAAIASPAQLDVSDASCSASPVC